MTDSTENKTTPESNKNLFENDFAYVSPDGEVVLKKTDLFEERTLTTVDPESAEEQIDALEKAFDALEAKVEQFFSNANLETEKIDEQFENLIDEITESDAIGDFTGLVDDTKKRFESLKSSVEEKPVEKEEPKQKTVKKEKAEKPTEEDEELKQKPKQKDEAEETAEVKQEEAVSTGETAEEPKVEPDSEKGTKEEPEAAENDADKEPSAEDYYRELAEKAETLGELTDWAYATMEFDNIDHLWGEGPDPENIDIKPYREKVDALREELEEKKRAHFEEQQRKRQENLEKKKELVKQLGEIVENKKWTLTRDVGRIKGKWDKIKSVPADEAEKLEAEFEKLLATFDEHKVDRLVKKKQQEEDNLTGKLVILEKMESFVEKLGDDDNWDDLEKDFANLTKQFRKIGRIPSEKNQEVWDRYHKAQDTFHSMRFKHDKSYRKQIEKFLSKKKKLIDEAEALIDDDDLAEAARKVNKLHRRWKKVGNLPQKDENEMWDRFKAATDAFNDKKTDNLDLLRKQEDENYTQKLTLIEEAEKLKDLEEWEQTHKELQKLMDRWKEVGPVPKRKSGKIWKKFKGAMDHFYDRRRDHFKEVKEERKDNLAEKEEVLKKLADLKTHDDPIKAVEIAKPLQEEFKKAGYVPIKHKNRMWKEYREICDVIYDRFRAAKSAVDVVGRENIDNFSVDDIADIRKKQSNVNKLEKEIKKLTGELLQMKESLSYFKPSSGGSSLLDEVKQKIEKAETDLEKKEDKLAQLEKEIDLIKKDA